MVSLPRSHLQEIADGTTCWGVFFTEPQQLIFVVQNNNVSRNCCAKYKNSY
jgi:hypothetical protein